MTVINVTEKYRQEGDPSMYERVLMALVPDIYSASSLSAIKTHFTQFLPRRKGLRYLTGSQPSVQVAINDLEIRAYSLIERIERLSREMDKFRMAISGASEEEMKISKPNHHNEPPMFKIRDSMDEELALWVGEDYRTAQKEYRNAQEEFGFNKDTFVPVHETWLRYYPFDNGGIFMITALDPYEKPKRNRKSLREKILENIPNFQTLVPQPSH